MKPSLLDAALAVPWCRLLLYYLLAGSLALTLATVARDLGIRQRAAAFTEVPGRVVVSRVQAVARGDALPVLVAEYAAGGRAYRAALVPAQGVEAATELDAAALVARFPVGATVPVFYDPAAPADAVFNRAPPVGGMAGGAAVLLAALLWVVRRDRRRLRDLPPAPVAEGAEATALVESARRTLARATRYAIGGVLLWPLSLAAWQLRAGGLDALRRGGVDARAPLLGALCIAGLVAPLALTAWWVTTR